MRIYIKTQGARIIKEGRHLLVKKGKDTYQTLFTHKLKQLLLFGNIEITHFALCQLLRHNIDTVFLTQNGRFLGRLDQPESKNVFLHKKQYELLDDNEFQLKMAKAIVAGKLLNMATFLMRIKRSKKAHFSGKKAKEIKQLISKMEQASDVNAVRGYEGKGSALYFSGIVHGFTDNFGFTKRVRRPPTDPINSVLSLLYTFLMNQTYSAVRITGLDPYPGFLHTIDYGRYSLVLDLMEEFRTIIADTLTLSLFNLKILQQKDFICEKPPTKSTQAEGLPLKDICDDPIGKMTFSESEQKIFDMPEQRIEEKTVKSIQLTGKYPVKLREDSFKRVIAAYEKKISTTFYYPPAQKNLTYMDALIYQAEHYRKIIEGKYETYQPLLMR